MVGGELTFVDRGAFIGDPCFREASYLWFGVCQLLSHGFDLVTNRPSISKKNTWYILKLLARLLSGVRFWWVRDLWLWLRFARGYGWMWC